MVHSFLITLSVLVGQVAPREVEPDMDNQARIKNYYSTWLGVRAPELGPEALDHHKKPVILSSFLGKPLLLFSFDAGNFNRGVDEKVLFANLRALDKARRTVGLDKLAVVGFSQGDVFVFPGPKPPGELGELTDFPVISAVPTSRRKFNEPYNLLLQPGAILIDRKGVIRAFYDHPMSEPELLDAVKLGDWDKPVRPAPVEDPWSGKGPPKSTHDAAVAWSRDIGGVVGMTSGDWDLRGSNDLIVANGGGFFGVGKFIVIDPEEGKELHRFPFKEIHSGMSYSLGWARVGNEKSAVFLTYQPTFRTSRPQFLRISVWHSTRWFQGGRRAIFQGFPRIGGRIFLTHESRTLKWMGSQEESPARIGESAWSSVGHPLEGDADDYLTTIHE